MTEQWIQQMREKMADYRKPASEVSWDEIELLVAAERQSHTAWWRRGVAAAAVMLLLAGTASYWMLTDNKTNQTMTTRPNTQRQAYRTEPPQPQQRAVPCPPNAAVRQISVPLLSEASPIQEQSAADSVITKTTDAEEKQDTVVERPKLRRGVTKERKDTKNIYPSELRKSSANRLTAKVYLSNTMGSSNRVKSYSNMLTSTTVTERTDETTHTHVYELDGSQEKENRGLWAEPIKHLVTVYDTLKTYRTEQTEERTHYHQPIRIGLSLRYQLDRQWSIETGVSYTRLTTDFFRNVDGVFSSMEVKTDYIGIPLNVGYQLWTERRFSVYASAGGMIEKSLNSAVWQFSLNGAAGMELKLNSLLGVYAEPGLGYYFDNGSVLPTIYQEKPFNFNLSLGLRFNLTAP